MQRLLKSDIGILAGKILAILMMLFLLRVIFFLINYLYFSDLSFLTILKALIYSVRIDMAALLIINGFLLLFLSLCPATYHRWRKELNAIFILANGTLIFLSVCDNIYFSYTQRRISYSLVYILSESFTWPLIWFYCKKGWYWILLLVVFFLSFKTLFRNEYGLKKVESPGWKTRCLTSIIILVICGIVIRGLDSRPFSPSTALLYFPSKVVNLACNTGLNIFYSYYKKQKNLPEKNYFTPEELDKRLPIFHKATFNGTSTKPNIVLLVMESFARDYLDSSSTFKAHTPFLDSLMHKSLVFKNAFNNGRESTHGLIAILASLPPFMQVPYYHSQYQSVSIKGLGKMLQEIGYDCSFFLGDVDNSFGFREFTHSIGIDHYYSRKDFDDDRFFNGTWGIHDENFFLYTADVLARKRQPYFATLFNVSSHPPFVIPAIHKNNFTIPGQNAAQNSISYVDYSYRSFFRKIKNESWFNNTIYIFIADHFYSPSEKKMLTAVNTNAIPFFIYAPGVPSLQGSRDYVVQQLDIVPTILDLAGYAGNYMSFGNSVLTNKSPGYAVQRVDYVNQVIDSSYVLGLDMVTDAMMYLYNYRTDSTLSKNLIHDPALSAKRTELENRLKAMIQRYNYSFNGNRLLNK